MDLYDIPDSNVQFYGDSVFFHPKVSSINSSISGIPESNRSQSYNGFSNITNKDLNIVNFKTITSAQGTNGQDLVEKSSILQPKILKSGIVIKKSGVLITNVPKI